jgi:DNA helicase-4
MSKQTGRVGLPALLFAFLHPTHAKSAAVEDGSVAFRFATGRAVVPLAEIASVWVEPGWFWASVNVSAASGVRSLSGLGKADARSFAMAIEEARTDWWREALATNSKALGSVHSWIAALPDPPRYVSMSFFAGLERTAREVSGRFPARWPEGISLTDGVQMLETTRRFLSNHAGARARANATFIANEPVRSKGFFDTVEAKPLTTEQRKAVVVDEDRNLVVAAAGSGKTSVIVAKAGWLVKKGYRRPSELLLIAFATDAKAEMEQRIRSRLGEEIASAVSVRTFHGLGLAIIGEAEGKRPSLAKVADDDKAMFALLKGIISDLLADPAFYGTMVTWFQSHFAPYRSLMEFRSWGEYWGYVRGNEIRSLKGDKVKSFEECELANFLFVNGVAYEYERPYEHDVADATHRQYQPDFFLPDVGEKGAYIEHFAIDAYGGTPPFIDRDGYLQSIEWKRRLHAEKGTILIETFSHERASGKLTSGLAAKLAEHDVAMKPIRPETVFSTLEEQGRIDPFTRLVSTFLQHFKGNQLMLAEAVRRAERTADRPRTEAFLRVFGSVHAKYQAWLAEHRQIDFNDMVAKATEHVESGRWTSPFGYVLVDEFQDISPGRARLLKALLDGKPGSQIFAVGDDWQAIYRFAGSDIAIMRDFRETFGASERVDLGTTFRCVDRIAETAAKFVLENPGQLRKSVSTVAKANDPCVHVGLPADEGSDLLREALSMIAAAEAERDGKAEVLLLGRYRHSRPEDMARLAKEFPGLKLDYKTVHRSKGLEADHAIILGLSSGKYGFPSEIADDPVLDVVLAAPEGHPNAEERRLLYVALTRARRSVFLLADGGPPSPFVREVLKGDYGVTVFGRPPEDDVTCPKCVEGRLKPRKGPQGGTFFGCTNWPYCDHTQPACPNCGTGLVAKRKDDARCRDCGASVDACPRCHGWLRPRTGKYGEFLGCTNWPACNYTKNVRTAEGT